MIGSSENRISYNGNGIATEFAYNFIILEKSDIKVLHVAADGTEQLLTKDYYVDMEKSVVLYPGYAPGAEIPEQNRPPVLPVGERLVIYREVPITQDSALDKHWPFNVIEDGLDKLTIICQQIWDRLQRSFYVSESTSTNFDPKVPIEAGKTFRVKDDGTGFEVTEDPGKVIDGATALLKQTTEQANIALESSTNAQNAAKEVKEIYGDGNFTPLSDLVGGLGTKLKRWGAIFANKVFASNLPIVYNSVAEMKADTMLWEGMNTKTLGYYTPNDGGGASYLIRAKADSDVADGGSLHELSNGLVAELIVENGTVCPEQFGARGDGITDDTGAFNCAISCGKRIMLDSTKVYFCTDYVNILDNIEFNLMNSTLRVDKALSLDNGCSFTNGNILYSGGDYASVINVKNNNNYISGINFKSTTVCGSYVHTETNADITIIDNCNFDDKSLIGVHVCGNRCIIQNSYFEDSIHSDSKTNCVKLSADNASDTITPCARNTIIRNCYLGYMNDNCIDTFMGADGLLVENCTFNNGIKDAIEIKDMYRKDENASPAGTSRKGLRNNRNITARNCTFLGTGYIAVISHVVESGYEYEVGKIEHIKFVDCIAPNLNTYPVAISDSLFVNDVVLDNLVMPAYDSKVLWYLYGDSVVVKNILNDYLSINTYGNCTIEKCKLAGIQTVGDNNKTEIINCEHSDLFSTNNEFIHVFAGQKIIVRDCYTPNSKNLVALEGAPAFMCLKNNICKYVMNNGYANAGGIEIVVNNLYSSNFVANESQLTVNQGNYKYTT